MSVGEFVTSGPLLLAAPVALAAGLVSFLSPCVLPLVPGYLSYVTGMSGADLAPAARVPAGLAPAPAVAQVRGRVLAGALLFVLGFTAVFTAEGALFGSLGGALVEHRRGLEQVLGVVTIVLGLAFAGAFARVPLASRELRLHLRPGSGLAAAPLLGALFGLGWTPCLGPTLSAVLGLSANASTAGRGAALTLAYCVGLGLPFLAVAAAFRRVLGAVAVVKDHYRLVMLVGGGLLVAVGLAEVTGLWGELVRQLQGAAGGVTVPL